jgi:A/G-specific adenine glycosylase
LLAVLEEYNRRTVQAPDPRRAARLLERWFARHQRPLPWREQYDPYHVWVSEVMLQQTRMEVVLPYFARFMQRFPSIESLARATEDEVIAAWSGLGYYRRGRMLREGALAVVERFGGVLPSATADLLTIPGIGRYTAGAIASVAFEKRAAIVDGNVGRVTARLFGSEGDAWERAEALVRACRSPRAFNQSLMELGALVCTPRNPSCLLCPVRSECVALATGRVAELPAPKAAKAMRSLSVPLYLVRDRRGRILMRRETGPLMNAMYHLPHGSTSLLTGKPLTPAVRELAGSFKHTITNRKIDFQVFFADLRVLRDSAGDYEWVDPGSLADIPHPSYVRKACRFLNAAG